MLELEFWQLIQESKDACGPNQTQKQSEFLEAKLTRLGKQAIIDFKIIFETKLAYADTWELAAVQFLSLDYLSDSGFDAFRAWVISQGENTYNAALQEPASLADILLAINKEDRDDAVVAEGECFLYCADTTYENLFHGDLWDEIPENVGKSEPNGEQPFDEQNICHVYPHLCAKFGIRN